MSISQDEIVEFNAPNKIKNSRNSPKGGKDVFELFTVKPQQSPTRLSESQKRSFDSQDTSELSDDVFIKPKPPVSLSTPSKSDTKSYRDKINDRFRIIKEKAGNSTRKANTFKRTTERILLEKVRRESDDINAELESIRKKFQLDRNTKNRNLYDFFCKENDEDIIAETQEDDNEKSTENLTETKQDLLFSLPQQLRNTLKAAEDENFYKPQGKSVDLSEKIEEEEPRYLEKEGFYVPNKPNVPSEHLNILEQRLSRDSKKWFNCEGKLDTIENPIQPISFRPQIKPLSSQETTIYLPAKAEEDDCGEIVVIKENILQLEVGKLKFNHHPLFSLEHVLEQKLRNLFKEYQHGVSTNNTTRLRKRLEALRHVLKRLEETSSQSGDQSDKEDDKTVAYRRDIRELQELLFEEGKKERERTKTILEIWKAVKDIRRKNNYSSTKIKLIIRKEKTNYEIEKENYELNIEEVLEEKLLEQQERSKRTKINEDELKTEIVQRFKESFRPPGEPILCFSLSEDNEITKIVENSKEITRRNLVSSTKVALRIICNKIEVCKTKFVNLNNNFCCNFDETISIQLLTVPKFLIIETIERQKSSLIKRPVGHILIKIPPRNVSKENKKITKQNFEINETVHYKHEGVGSGVKVEIPGMEELKTSGYLSISLTWNTSTDESKQDFNHVKILNEIITKNGAIDIEKLSEWIHQNKPDPQDPKNSILYEYSIGVDDQNHFNVENKKKYFRLNPFVEDFCDFKVLEDNLRLKILQLRDRNEPEFDRMMVPNRLKEIPLNILDDYKRRIESESEGIVIEEEDDDDELESKRRHGQKFLKQIYTKVFQKCKNSQNNLTFDDVVDEKLLTYFEKFVKSLANNFLDWFRWRPLKVPLPEVRKDSKSSKLDDYQTKYHTKIIFKIISGFNIPRRGDKNEVAPFIEIHFNNTIERTSSGQGANPTWNEEIFFPLDSSQVDYLNPSSLNGTITLNIFDENDETLTKLGGIKSKTWLGSLEIPLTAICYNEMEGMFKVKTPQLLIGYNENEKHTKSQSNEQTYLNLKVTIEPPIPKLSPNIEELPSSEVPYLKDFALKWNENYNSSFPGRKFSVFAIDINATTVCIVRYIRPLEPPQINVEGFDLAPDQCARYVSLIPFTDCHHFYQNIWLTVDQLLHFMIGSTIDHAVALTCYLLALKLDVWLLLGFGIPYGSTAFVLVKEHDNNQTINYYIYDVVAGEKFYLTDAFCPLQKIYCVVNEQNVWANIQRNDNINLTRFDFNRRSDWLPLFNNQVTAPTNSIHGKISYGPRVETDELEIILDRKIRKKLAKMRQLDRTIWNHHISNAFKYALNSFENYFMCGKTHFETVVKLKEWTKTYWMKGHVINIPFTNVSSIMKKIKSFGLHLDDPNTQYASAVYAKSYPNQVLTVWIFAASIREK